MKRHHYFFTSVALFALIFSGCEKDEEPFNETNSNLKESVIEENYSGTKLQEEKEKPYFFTEFEKNNINDYYVTFTGREIKVTNNITTTTFNYTVSGTNKTPQLDSFYLEIPGCAGDLLSWTPQQSSRLEIGKIIWNSSVSKDGSQDYSITFKGEVPLGIINATVTRGSDVETDKVIGPCQGVYSISGYVYVDANKDGVKDASESGIPSIPVVLFNSDGDSLTTTSTNEKGLYSFMVLEERYTIAIGEDLLNDENYTAVGSNSVDLEKVTEDLTGINFGYNVNTSKITKDLEDKIIPVNTEPIKFWVTAFRNIDKRKEVYSREIMMGFLSEIEGLYLPEPFQFGEDKIAAAEKILNNPMRTDLDVFLAQLLVAQLNVVSGRGALKSDGELNTVFNDALLIYGEAVACRESGNCPYQISNTAATEQTKLSRIDTNMLLAFNGSGGVN